MLFNYKDFFSITFAFISFLGRCPAPRSIKVESFAFFTIASGRVVSAVATQLTVASAHTFGGVAVAFAPAADGEIGRRVKRIVAHQRVVVPDQILAVRVQSVEGDAHVSGRHPVLQDRTVFEIERTGPTLHGAEGDARSGQRIQRRMRVRAKSFLFVGFGDDGPVGSAVQLATLRRVELERLPRFAEIHTFVNGQTVGFSAAELQTDVRQFVLFAQ